MFTEVRAVIGPDHAQIRLPELAPRQVKLVERDHQSVLFVLRQQAHDALHAVPVVKLADLILFEHVAVVGSLRRGFRGERCGRDAPRIVLHLAVGIADVVNIRNGQDIGRAVGIREALVAHVLRRDFDHLGFDFRGVRLDDQLLGRGRQNPENGGRQQQHDFFHFT